MGWSYDDLRLAPSGWVQIIIGLMKREADEMAKISGRKGDDG